MADNEAALHGTTQTIIVGYRIPLTIFFLQIFIDVDRTVYDLVFNVSSAVDSLMSTPNHVEIDTILSLSDLSTAEGQNTELNIFFPPFVTCQANITSDKKEIISLQRFERSLSLEIGQLFFTDEVHIKTILDADSSVQVPMGISGLSSVLVLQPMADKHDETDVAGSFEYVNITVTTTTALSACIRNISFNNEAEACQFSSSPESITPAYEARWDSTSGWTPFVHLGAVRRERYIQAYFGNKVLINHIRMLQTGAAKAKTLKLRYSNDGVAWVEKPGNLISPNPSINDESLPVPAPETSRYIRVMISELDDNSLTAAFKFSFIGCETTNDKPADLCTAVVSPPTPLADFKRRTFVVAGTTVYVCDMVQEHLSIKQKCYFSRDHLTWIAVNRQVGSLIGYDPGEPRVYGMSSDGLQYMSSVDGTVWKTSITSHVESARLKLGFKAAVEVPFTADANLQGATPDALYQDLPYGATITGLKHFDGANWNQVFSWGDCCP
ncbi:hypothetical protein EGW08_015429 [Elysia chlorotica]|uniref:F5/8 type C domain-containing protein n=1 Tax=Elysia chlorotica TaxID=188477 RepID=A0A3S1BBM0_ELYCH|nr:hypothetical protein EGW08_015429 [Elysia chlorotica]